MNTKLTVAGWSFCAGMHCDDTKSLILAERLGEHHYKSLESVLSYIRPNENQN